MEMHQCHVHKVFFYVNGISQEWNRIILILLIIDDHQMVIKFK